MLIKLAWREMLNNKRFSMLFMLNLAIGLSAFVTLDGFKRNLDQVLQGASKNLLTADLAIGSRREINDEEISKVIDLLGQKAKHHEVYTLYSMANHGDRSTLVELKFIENSHPWYGQIELRQQGVIKSGTVRNINEKNSVWLAPELLIQLDMQIGDKISLGAKEFIVEDVIEDDIGMSWTGASVAPRIYMGSNQLEATQLMRKGSTFRHGVLFKLPPDLNANEAEEKINALFDDPAVRVTSHQHSGENTARVLQYLSDYLGLVALIAFFLSGVGAAYLFRGYLGYKTKEIAILMAVGLDPIKAVCLYMMQLFVLGLAAALIASALGSMLLPVTGVLISQLSPLPLDPQLPLASIILTIIIGAGGAVILCLPLLMHISHIKPATLFQEASGHYPPVFGKREFLGMLPVAITFYLAAVWQAHSWFVGSLFVGLLAVSSGLIIGTGWLALKKLPQKMATKLPLRTAFRYLSRSPVHALAGFLALSVGSLLINLIVQVQHSLSSEIGNPNGKEIPSLFLFDIQEDQKQEMVDFIKEQGNETLYTSPIVRARIKSINGKPFEKNTEQNFSREKQQEARMRNRGVNLSWDAKLTASETLTKGRPFSGDYVFDPAANPAKPGEVSLEVRYARRLGIKLGDQITFDVQSIPIEGKVVSLRKVQWNNFRPNFLIKFQPGVLDDAPKTFISVIPSIGFEEKTKLQTAIVKQFPNISIIDVSKVVGKVVSLTEQMLWILNFIAAIALLAGLIVIYSIANHQVKYRTADSNLMKILGATFGQIRASVLWEFFFLSLGAGIFGGVLGLLASWVFTVLVLNASWQAGWLAPLVISLGLIMTSLIVVISATNKVLRQHPKLLL